MKRPGNIIIQKKGIKKRKFNELLLKTFKLAKSVKILVLITFAVLYYSAALAQKTGFYWYNLNENSNRLQGKLKGEIYTISAIGSENIFYQQDWKEATITLTDGDVFENVKLRYLAYGDEIIAYNENVRKLFKVEKETVKQFTYIDEDTNKEIKFVNVCSEELFNGCRFFEELYSGNSKLMAFHFVEEIKVNPYTDRRGFMRDSEYRMNISYFLFNDTRGFVKVKSSRRSLVKNFPDKKREIKKLMRKNKQIIIDQNSMIQAIALIDEAGLFY